MSILSDRRIEKEDINSYIVKKREMFLVQYSLGVKRDEISKLEEIAKVIIIPLQYAYVRYVVLIGRRTKIGNS